MNLFRIIVQKITILLGLLFRRKVNVSREHQSGNRDTFSECLTTFDLTNLGIGSILGAGIYVVVGQVAMNIAGPSVTLSLAIAAITSLLSGLCYAEFGSRVPKTTGSAYAYSYHTVGEFVAFIIGWNLILEYMIGTAADARALSSAIDYLLGHRISNFTLTKIGYVPLTGATPDLLGFSLTITVTIVLATGVKESVRFTTVFNILTGIVGLFIIITGSIKSDFSNWNSTAKFFPKGGHGVLAGTATCFYAYVGFDIIATAGEESRSPSRSIPTAMALTLAICFFFYLGVSTVLTMMMPYGSLHSDTPITEAFDKKGLHWTKWIVGIGGVAGMSASLMGSEFPLPRIIYAMSSDGLLFKFLSYIWNRTEVPVFATLLPGLFTAFFTMLFDLSELVEMMSIGTLLAYSLVCTSILVLRYQKPEGSKHSNNIDFHSAPSTSDMVDNIDNSPLIITGNGDLKVVKHVSKMMKVVLVISLIWFLSICFANTALFGEHLLISRNGYIIALFSVFLLGIVACTIWLSIQNQDKVTLDKLHFKVPLVPLLPICAITFNIMLMVRLSYVTWIRFTVWLALGLVLYFGYGFRHSKLNKKYSAVPQHDNEIILQDMAETK